MQVYYIYYTKQSSCTKSRCYLCNSYYKMHINIANSSSKPQDYYHKDQDRSIALAILLNIPKKLIKILTNELLYVQFLHIYCV